MEQVLFDYSVSIDIGQVLFCFEIEFLSVLPCLLLMFCAAMFVFCFLLIK